jgi:tRNA threonylcarbamoyladenosine biosynthesis protein TsaB
MPLILALETSTDVCSVALQENGSLVAYSELRKENSHAEKITVAIKQLFDLTNLSLNNISAVAVSKGPGSYTGLRIGTSVAKGICFALDVPFISVNTLISMASQVQILSEKDTILCPMLDARRMEVYTTLLNSDLSVITETSALILNENSFSGVLSKNKVFFFGNGSEKFKSVTKSQNALFIPGIKPSAKDIAIFAEKNYREKMFEDVTYFEPFYLKDFVSTQPK